MAIIISLYRMPVGRWEQQSLLGGTSLRSLTSNDIYEETHKIHCKIINREQAISDTYWSRLQLSGSQNEPAVATKDEG